MARSADLQSAAAQGPASLAAEFAHEQPLGFVVLEGEVAAHAAEAVGQTQLLPAVGSVNGAAERLGIHERFHQHHGMTVASLPVGAQALESQTQGSRAEVGESFVGQEQEPAVVDHQRQAASA